MKPAFSFWESRKSVTMAPSVEVVSEAESSEAPSRRGDHPLRGRWRQRWIFLVALLLATLVTALAASSVYRRVETFQPLGFTGHSEGAGVVVDRVTHPATGLQLGDQIFMIRGREVEEAARQLRARSESRLLLTRDGQVREVLYRRPALNLDWPFLVLTLVGAGYLLIGLYTLFKHRPSTGRRQAGFLFFLWCLASAGLYLLSPVFLVTGHGEPDGLDKIVYLGDLMARLALPALTLHLFLVFPDPLPRSARGVARLRGALPFVYLPAAVLALLHVDLVAYDGGHLFRTGLGTGIARGVELLQNLELVHWVAFGLAAVGLLGLRLLRQKNWEKRRQVQWIAVGMAGGYIPFAVLYLVPWLFGFRAAEGVQVAAVLPLGLVPLAFAYAILRYKLWDIEAIVRDTISSTVTLMLGVLGFSLAHLAITRGLSPDLTLARNLLSFLAGLSIAGLLLPARRVISDGLERLQYRGNFLKRRALSQLADELLRERDLTRLSRHLADRLEEAVPLSQVNLYLIDGPALAPVRPEPELPAALTFEELGERFWRGSVHPLSAISLPAEELTAEQRLFIAGYRYVFPLEVSSHRVGLILAGYKPGESPLNSDDIELVRQLLDQASLAIENAQLLGELSQRLDEVSRLQEYSEGIFESSPAGIAVLDSQTRVVSANAAFAELTATSEGAVARPSALTRRPLHDILPVQPLPEPGQGPLEVSYCDLSGREHYYQLSMSTFTRGVGDLRILVVHDVSERVAMENALRESDRLAALGMLAAGVAHEVNTPITGISSYAQMLLADTDREDPRYELLQKVERQTFRASRIVNNLLEFARNTSSEHRPVELAPLITETLDLLKERWSKRRIRIEWRPPPDPVRVLGNTGELQQVLTNLFVNAADAMGARSGSVEGEGAEGGILQIEVREGESMVELSVEDTGVGIPPERLETIFQPFFSTKLTSGGTGLGLSISFEIVRRHGGDIRVESRVGHGTRFLVELPKAGEDEGQDGGGGGDGATATPEAES